MLKKPPTWMLSKILREELILSKVEETMIDSYDEYGVTEETETTYTIKGFIEIITLEEVALLPAGGYEVGDARGYFLPSYIVDGVTVAIEVNDYIKTSDNVKYRVISITDHRDQGRTVHREVYLRRVSGI